MADIITLIHEEHDWIRRRFFDLDSARTDDELTAIWDILADRLDIHAQAEEEIFYPSLLVEGTANPRDETEDAIRDHNKIRAAIRDSRRHGVDTEPWREAVSRAREENGEHLDEEEREAFPDFIKSASLDLRHELGMRWLRFTHRHPTTVDIDTAPRNPTAFIDEHA